MQGFLSPTLAFSLLTLCLLTLSAGCGGDKEDTATTTEPTTSVVTVTGDWAGTRSYRVTDASGELLCDIVWTTTGTPAMSPCPVCDFTYSLTGTGGLDAVGGCGDQPDVTLKLGYAADYYGAEVVFGSYGGSWYPAYYASLAGDQLTYWYTSAPVDLQGSEVIYDWSGAATFGATASR